MHAVTWHLRQTISIFFLLKKAKSCENDSTKIIFLRDLLEVGKNFVYFFSLFCVFFSPLFYIFFVMFIFLHERNKIHLILYIFCEYFQWNHCENVIMFWSLLIAHISILPCMLEQSLIFSSIVSSFFYKPKYLDAFDLILPI